jgi:hypothetical protein
MWSPLPRHPKPSSKPVKRVNHTVLIVSGSECLVFKMRVEIRTPPIHEGCGDFFLSF